MADNPINHCAISIRFPEPLHQKLTQAAKERGLSVNYLATKAIEDFLTRLIPVEEFKLTRD